MSKLLNNERFFFILTLFILFQPILDILTALTIRYLDISLTVGIVVRVLFMGVALLYIFFGSEHPYKKYIVGYLALLIAVLGIGFINNFFQKPVFNLFIEVQWLTKTLYFSVMLCSMLLLFSNRKMLEQTKARLLHYIVYALLIVSVSIFIAILTNTSVNSYEWVKGGFKGWFYSANELSALLAIGFPLAYVYGLRKTEQWRDFRYWIPAVIIGITGGIVGTKVGLFAVIITSILLSLFTVIHFLILFFQKKTEHGSFLQKLVFSLGFLAMLFIFSPFTPGYQNLSVDMPAPDQNDIDKGFEDLLTDEDEGEEENDGNTNDGGNQDGKDEEEEIVEGEDTRITFELDAPIINKILSSRQIYFTWQLNQMVRADVSQKILGMGYAGNYINNRKTIEMDFFDIFFSYGIVGFLLVMFPLFLLIWTVVKNLFTNFQEVVKIENIGLMVSILLGLGIALIAGHVWVAPAVNIYLAMSMVLLYMNLKVKTKND
ncbi:O-antigen ligase family protein [Gracilibacillus sp. YIM 98692]|uniref:O-antigen ligase family protein n=1 Tax=Gracilibacillus sp. YIM 98692 TaxID=2663532 RepID=UPI0013D28C8A|nr:O-antigen ligase family protein [Gracilibacillus sp. YIM 98692]